ncbi:5-amino-6-(D-ribitylamino)uracil--L-tyrosine 4-hydroxyphenyl transferase CofH [Methanonatronarchaeum sp. AMET-Sl]|uniref:5-amino-6-(D-ribitylamino)uracil--L-tyrosine 4-hydroxyphenyl transferase CofH n=1 Tax=Methanonatronarchaeum sp. AMET-Sl TaxID=3037654 RepID=UPI00244DDB8E|nr:5-amino-6-(D-ribitylamino)uracil--L-tyrosine 4-hydroxyphenyl transferase CofH [Methanonatronarchaeum sp. AMET-Sl]WGI17728.1 5-amino-6-(D-ribitylamino)uracil--L-tyrosine 4-hydroxyphenyl transferase CofH [Methanonatronarchaeum sp. AMET-Sl]
MQTNIDPYTLPKKNNKELYREADRLTKNKHDKKVTYIKNRNINFTNICKLNCKFCAYSVKPKTNQGHQDTKKQVLKKVEKAANQGATEVCIQGGINPELTYSWYRELIKTINKKHNIHIHAFSPQEIHHMTQKNNLTTKKTLKQLKKAGLDSMPGTAAEILNDKIRNKICPNKINSQRWREIIETAHKQGIPTTATMMYGHTETWKDRINHILKIREIQKKHQGFTEFIPLPFIPGNNKLSKTKPTPLHENYKVIAIARILLHNQIPNIQASWVKLGPKNAAKALNKGANDLGGTLMEENISSSTGKPIKTKITTKQLKKTIKKTGHKPIQRTTTYQKPPKKPHKIKK